MATPAEPLYIGTNHHVAAIDTANGSELWRTKLPDSMGIVTILVRGEVLFAGSGGHLYALDRFTGRILWHNGLKGLGHFPVTMGMLGEPPTDIAGLGVDAATDPDSTYGAG
ncbi:MAG: PQQ-binding-like beta-propeller repeat protein [Phycisphaerae bacterium]|nr:PQQ-binding-like beta-propeller repeat protein [Phycisphaerae bacterium]